jgi:3'-phosphoadenosine 5'-phosphosulfate sulfotransferase (PAPS reductase)/FAD synthetase
MTIFENQLTFFPKVEEEKSIPLIDNTDSRTESEILDEIDYESYDRVIVFYSTGKDSIVSFLDILERGVPLDRIELHHHIVDGMEGSTLMDWPCTNAYAEEFAKAFNVPLFSSWRKGGLEAEMLRENSLTNASVTQNVDGSFVESGGISGKPNTRLKFPQKAASLTTRWCSAYLKVDVASKIFTASSRFNNSRTLVVTGERAEESPNRSRYSVFEVDRSDARNGKLKRHIDHVRNVKHWSEKQVWDKIEEYKIAPHPSYLLGWGRNSCLTCIFGSPNQWATIRKHMPDRFKAMADYEAQFGVTIDRKLTLDQMADKGVPYELNQADLKVAMSETWDTPIILEESDWKLPAGAFGESNGPT